MSEHTPGPWTVRHRHVLCGPDDDESCGLGLEVDGPPEPMRGKFALAADARLVAAAPDMLAVLVDIADGPNRTPPEVAAVIAKAKGETE